MSSINKLMWGRNPESFDDVQLGMSAHRDLFTIDKEGRIDAVMPPVLTHEEACEKIAALGGPSIIESYVDMRSGAQVIRAKVLANGIDHYVMIVYDTLYEYIVDAALVGLKHSRIAKDEQ